MNEEAIRAYAMKAFGDVVAIDIRRMGAGVHGAGFSIEIETTSGKKSYVIKALTPEGLGHDYPSDRAAVFLLGLDEFHNLPNHVRAIDVLAEMADGSVKPIGGGKEYYLLMEKAEGTDYFQDLRLLAQKERLDALDREKIISLTSYLARIHAVKRDSPTLYRRKLRDTVGHGECLMGVFDTYPDGVVAEDEMSQIIKKSVDWIIKLKPKHKRLSQVHGDFHPGNIWFQSPAVSQQVERSTDFILLDRSRGPWGEPADDVTALTINYIFFSILATGDVRGAYREALELFYREYISASRDEEMLAVVAPFYAFRGAVVGNPLFYPDVTDEQRKKIFRFVLNVLDDGAFDVGKVNEYLR